GAGERAARTERRERDAPGGGAEEYARPAAPRQGVRSLHAGARQDGRQGEREGARDHAHAARPAARRRGSWRMKIKRIAHVAVAVPSSDEALPRFLRVLGLAASDGSREIVASQKVETAMVPVGDGAIELIEPKGNEALAKFLEKRGTGLHHVAVEVEGIE